MWIFRRFVVCAADNAPAAGLEVLSALRVGRHLLRTPVGVVVHLDDEVELGNEDVGEEAKTI